MYFGSTGPTGLEQLLLEVVSNSVDQYIAGHADHLAVSFNGDGSVTISDDGLGIPVAAGESGVPFVEEMFTTLRATPTADGHAPHVHLSVGVGLGPVSAVCQSIVVHTVVDGVAYRQTFERGRVTSPLHARQSPSGAVGTTVRLLPDPEIFGHTTWDTEALRTHLRTIAQLTPGLTVTVNGERFGPVGDLSELFADVRGPNWDLLHRDPFLITGSDDLSSATIALGWIEPRVNPRFRSFVNFLEMSEGGTHHQGIEEGLRLVFGAAPMRDLMLGLIGVVHLTMLRPDVGGPTRGRLDSPEAIWLVADAIAAGLPPQLDHHPAFTRTLQERVPLRR